VVQDKTSENTKEYFNLDVGKGEVNFKKTTEAEIRKKRNNGQSWYYLGVFGEIGFAIALPIVGGALLGSFLDKEFSLYPKATLTGLIVGVLLSVIYFVRTILDIIKEN
jgi:ATP synthase protein I